MSGIIDVADDGAWQTSGYPPGLNIYREDVWPLPRHRSPGDTITREEHAGVPAAVYFVLGGDLVKIGLSINPEKRLRALRSASPLELTMHRLVTCSRADSRIIERELHRQFGAFRHHDEWFEAAPVLSVTERLTDREICALRHVRPATEQERAEIEREATETHEAYKRQQRDEATAARARREAADRRARAKLADEQQAAARAFVRRARPEPGSIAELMAARNHRTVLSMYEVAALHQYGQTAAEFYESYLASVSPLEAAILRRGHTNPQDQPCRLCELADEEQNRHWRFRLENSSARVTGRPPRIEEGLDVFPDLKCLRGLP